MCGIVGIATSDIAGLPDYESVRTMCALLSHRGPDDDGFYFGRRITLGMRRLAIIDVARGQQPVASEDGAVRVVFNGELYNFRELRTTLEARGHRLSSHSDTECIVHLYEDYGDACVDHLRGMFAFAVWDERRGRLLLARDRFGIKPLYYCRPNGQLAFSSEIKSLLALPGVERTIDPEAMSAFFTFGYVPGPSTIYSGIQEIPPAHVATWSNGEFRLARYWDLRPNPDYTKSLERFADELRGRLEEAVRLHLESEVELGAFLSGGLDSSAVVALMSRVSARPARTMTIGFTTDEPKYDERKFARTVARAVGTDHSERLIDPDVGAILPAIVRALDEPFADSSVIPTYAICQAARECVTVALSGLGGDELFAGYERYRGALLAEHYRRVPRLVRRGLIDPAIAALREPRNGSRWTPRLKRFVNAADLDLEARYQSYVATYDDAQKARLFTGDVSREIHRLGPTTPAMASTGGNMHPLDRMLLADVGTYLPGDLLRMTDRLSMCHSLEVRVPFLDHELVEFVATIPAEYKLGRGWRKKLVLRHAMAGILPAEVLNRRKQGFSVPLNNWLRGPLRELARSYLGEASLRRVGMFNAPMVARMLQEHETRAVDHESRLWTLLMFLLWHEQYIVRVPAPVSHA